MANVLIRGVDDADLRAIDHLAKRLGLSRGEFLRRETKRIAARETRTATDADFERAAALAQDVLNDEVMRGAW